MTANPSKPGDKGSTRIPSSEARRNKPQIEKRRRARINQSLSILKTLIVDTSIEKKPSKFEKADILEFTVHYLQKNQKQTSDLDEKKFTEGYQECTKATLKFLESCNIDQSTLEKLVEFLKFRRPSANQILFDGKTDNFKWESFSKTRKIDPKVIEDKHLNNVFDSESSTSTTHSPPPTSNTCLDLQFINAMKINSLSSNIPSPDPQTSHQIDSSSTSDLHNKVPEICTSPLPSTPSNHKAFQLISPVDLSRDFSKNCNSSYYLHNTNRNNSSSTNCNDNDINQPLDLCCKYSRQEEHGVWRPW